MKSSRLLRVLGIGLVLSVLAAMIPATAALAAQQGTLSISVATGPIGTSVTATGNGYTASTAYTLYFGNSAVATGTANATGYFAPTFAVPAGYPRGTYYVTVVTGAADTTAAAPTFVITPSVSLSASSGYVGDQVTVTGSGFGAGVQVIIYFDTAPLLTTTSNAYGQVSVAMTVPPSAGGTHAVTASDGYGGPAVPPTFSVLAKMAVTPTSGAVGDQMAISGTGYGASQLATIYFDGSAIGTTYSNAVGTVAQISLAVPASARGNHTVTMTDALGFTYSVTFVTSQRMTISPATGPGGTSVSVSGTGFNASAAITITFDDAATDAPATTASAIGSFGPVSFKVPVSPGGAHTVKASDGTNTDSKSFTVTTAATINPTSGFVGSTFTVNGAGFLGSQTVSILFDNAQVKSVTSGANGSFSTTVDVPAKAGGTYTVRITDGTNTINVNYAITTTVSISPVTSAGSPGYVGQQVTVSGVGFIAGRTVTVTYDGQTVGTPTTVGTDNKFSLTFGAPASVKGKHTITVSDGLNSLPLDFYMEGNAPPIPALLKPDNGARDGGKPTFSWTSVTDVSGVTYNLQVASSQDFSAASIVLQETGLTSGQYTVTQAEKLKSVSSKTPYYWRVSAVDRASNTAGYSTPRAYSVGFVLELPTWAVIVLIVLGVVIVALLFFWLGRSMAARRPLV